jgi:light-regulated signal transduction histidine kinase (bacteriophytochrome)
MMPEMSGIDLLRSALAIDPELVGIMMTGHGTIDSAVSAMRAGAFDYILKPFKLGVILPVLARSLAVRKLRMEKSELERQVQARTAELEVANRELESFSYSVAHDLRAPLRSIDGFSQVILEDSGERLDAQAREHLLLVQRAAKRMQELIDDLLGLARINRADIDIKGIDASALAHTVIGEIRARDPGREVEVSIKDGMHIAADARLMRVVMENLLGNAWKFTARTDKPRIEVGSTSAERSVVLHLRDNGAGFDQNRAGQMFRAFRRLHSEEEFPGTGIGLATVHRIIERHGGRIWAEGAVGSGATFFIELKHPHAAETPAP